jgi:branched-subunit amino acid aminotransferase/4-amino-4-deoxychorismate lyase
LLRLRLPLEPTAFEARASQLIHRNGLTEGVLRVQITRGSGTRGYSSRGATVPTLVITTHPLEAMGDEPLRWRLHTASLRLGASDTLARVKTCNRLLNILARAEAEAHGADEALLVDAAGEVVEAASANVFWIERGELHTPSLGTGALPGVTRAAVIELARAQEKRVQESSGLRERLLEAEGLFLTLSSHGIIEVLSLDGQPVQLSPVTLALRRAYLREVYGRTRPH